jgi:hypothetical protein
MEYISRNNDNANGPVIEDEMWNSSAMALTVGVVIVDDNGIRNSGIEMVAMMVHFRFAGQS